MAYVPTAEQNAILAHDYHRHAVVLAGPGTGKSATLVALVDRLLEGNPAPRIKLLTFTRAATAELAKKISEHPAAAAQRPSTIHSFSISVLLQNPGTGEFPQPLRIADSWEDAELVRPTLARRIGVRVDKLEELIREMASNWESLHLRESPRVAQEHRARFNGAWAEHRQIYGYTLLAELPYALLQALQHHQDLDGVQYDLMVVDEYQDLNACDLSVLHQIARRGCSIVGAGDDDQSIYSFRRAAPEGIRRFSDDYVGCAVYPLSITQRCGSHIIDWATYVIEGDPSRPAGRPRLRSAPGSPPGEVALLSFAGERAEARGVAQLVRHLTEDEHVPVSEILILLRGDYHGTFSGPIKEALQAAEIAYSDSDAVELLLSEPNNRSLLATLRLLVNPEDSLAWATLLHFATGVGTALSDYVYNRARDARVPFGSALMTAHAEGFPDGPRSSGLAGSVIHSVGDWLNEHLLPEAPPASGWGHWIVEVAGGSILPAPSNDLTSLLYALDSVVEADQDFGRFLAQLTPLGKDLAIAQSAGVRIMTMNGAKGLTARATIVVGLEEGIVPRPDGDLQEERRLLYVAMTRAKEFLFGTWARRRRGPTARAGAPRVAIRRSLTNFLRGGPVDSKDGAEYLQLHRGDR